MATNLGQAYVQIMPSARGIGSSIQRELNGQSGGIASAGAMIGSKLMGAMQAVIITAGIGKVIGMSITEGGELEQSLGGVETLFKENADKVKQYANVAYKTVGVSANDYMKNVTSFSASLLQATGRDTEKAAEVANMAMIDMADNANKMGTNIQSIQDAYQGFAKQNYTMLDNLKLGFGGTKSEMQRLLQEAQKISGIEYNIDNLADVYSAIHVIQENLGIMGTTSKEASETFQGSLLAMKAAFQNVLGGLSIGLDISEHLSALGETTATFLFKNFIPMVINIIKALPGAIFSFIKGAVPYFIQGGQELIGGISGGFEIGYVEILRNFTQILTDVLGKITEYMPSVSSKADEFIGSFVKGILGAIPNVLSTVGDVFIAILDFFLKNYPLILKSGNELLLNFIVGFKENLPRFGEVVIELISKFIDIILQNAPNYIKSGVEIVKNLAIGIISNLPEIVLSALTIILNFIKMILSKIPDIGMAGIRIVKALIQGIFGVEDEVFQKGLELAQGLLSRITKWTSKFFDAGKNIVQSIANGIKNSISMVTNAIDNVVSKVRDFLPFSPAKTGPLSDLHRLDFGIIADGIYNAKKPVESAMRSLTQGAVGSIDLNSKVGYSLSSANVNSGAVQSPIVINQNIYAKTEDERSQQKEAFRNFKRMMEEYEKVNI